MLWIKPGFILASEWHNRFTINKDIKDYKVIHGHKDFQIKYSINKQILAL